MESETLTKRKSSDESNRNPKNDEDDQEIGLKAKMTLMNGVTVIVGKVDLKF